MTANWTFLNEFIANLFIHFAFIPTQKNGKKKRCGTDTFLLATATVSYFRCSLAKDSTVVPAINSSPTASNKWSHIAGGRKIQVTLLGNIL